MEDRFGDMNVTEDIVKRSILIGIGVAILFVTFTYIVISAAWLVVDGLPTNIPGMINWNNLMVAQEVTPLTVRHIEEYMMGVITVSGLGGFIGSVLIVWGNKTS